MFKKLKEIEYKMTKYFTKKHMFTIAESFVEVSNENKRDFLAEVLSGLTKLISLYIAYGTPRDKEKREGLAEVVCASIKKHAKLYSFLPSKDENN